MTTEDDTEQVSWKSVPELNDSTEEMTGWTGSWHPGKSQVAWLPLQIPAQQNVSQEMRKVRNAKAQGMRWFGEEVTRNRDFGTNWSKCGESTPRTGPR